MVGVGRPLLGSIGGIIFVLSVFSLYLAKFHPRQLDIRTMQFDPLKPGDNFPRRRASKAFAVRRPLVTGWSVARRMLSFDCRQRSHLRCIPREERKRGRAGSR